MRYRSVIRIVLLLVLLAGVAIAVFNSFTKDERKVQEGDMAPDFQLQTLQGDTLRLSELRGKGVLLNFWGTWCKPCKEEMPALERVYQEMKEKNMEVTIVGVNIAESNVTVESFVERNNLHFPILLDRKREVTNLYGIGPIPTTYFIRPDGTINKIIIGGPMSEQIITSNLLEVTP